VLSDFEDPEFPYRGVVHAAGVLRDGPISSATRESITEVLRPKFLGALNLDQLTRRYPIERFVMFSSAASILGSPGQSAYAAANAAVDAVAQQRRREGLHGVSLNWGPWMSEGLAARTLEAREALQQAASAQLIKMLSVGAALTMFEAALDTATPEDLCILPFKVQDLLQFYRSASGGRLFQGLIDRDILLDSHGVMSRPRLATAYVAPRTSLERSLADQIQQALEIDKVGVDDSLFELGADSVTVGRVLSRMQVRYGVELEAEALYSDLTVATIAAQVDSALLRLVAGLEDSEASDLLERFEAAAADE